jgi:hypothetical protein
VLDDYAFPSRTDHARHISTRQYARLVDEWVTAIGLRREDYGTHSLRRTKASIIYKATGNLRAVQLLLVTPRSRARCATSGWTSRMRSLSLSIWRYEAVRPAGSCLQAAPDPMLTLALQRSSLHRHPAKSTRRALSLRATHRRQPNR